MDTVIPVPTLLTAAADLLERNGWIQNQGGDLTGRRCAVSAVAAASNNPGDHVAWAPAVRAVEAYLGLRTGRLMVWNDQPGRLAAEVVRVFRDVADLLRVDEAVAELVAEPVLEPVA